MEENRMTMMTNMQPLHVPLQNNLDKQVTDAAPDRAGTATQSLSIESRRTTDIALVTSEGDRVTLSATSLFEATYEAYNSKGVMNTGVTGETLTLTASSALAISVEGSLNEQELEDIERIVSTMREMASEFFAGEVEEELSELFEEDHGLGTIASFRADISNTFSVLYNYQQAAAPVETAGTGAVSPAPFAAQPVNGANPEPTPVSVGETAQGTQAAPSATLSATRPANGANSDPVPVTVGETIQEAQATTSAATPGSEPAAITVESSHNFANNLIRAIGEMNMTFSVMGNHLIEAMEQIFEEIAEKHDHDSVKQQIADTILDDVTSKVLEMASHEAREREEIDDHHDDDKDHDHNHDHDHKRVEEHHNKVVGDGPNRGGGTVAPLAA
jgi:predicted small metal-binding protein